MPQLAGHFPAELLGADFSLKR